MTPRQATDNAVVEAQRRFRYIADPPLTDEWDTVREFTARGGGDCDGWALWAIWRAQGRCPGEYRFVRGIASGIGHAWVEIRDPDRLWADPTWGEPCHDPGWYSERTPQLAYLLAGEIMGPPTAYEVV